MSRPTQPDLFSGNDPGRSLRLDRPLVVFDLEATGTEPLEDRIVEIAACRVNPGGERAWLDRRVHPGRPIPPEASAIHGIHDADVADAPRFEAIADEVRRFFEGADLGGYNLTRYDVPLLDAEFRRAGVEADLAGRRIVDAMTIYHRKERRDLAAAVRLYLGGDHADAHNARADVEATVGVLEAQVARYDDLPETVAGLDAWCKAPPEGALDHGRRLVWKGEQVVVNFGPHRGRGLRDLVRDPDGKGFLRWILNKDFDDDVKRVVRDALDANRFPEPPGADDQST